MKKFINGVDQVEDQMIQGMVKAYPKHLRKLESFVLRKKKERLR